MKRRATGGPGKWGHYQSRQGGVVQNVTQAKWLEDYREVWQFDQYYSLPVIQHR